MPSEIKIGIVEDELIIAEKIKRLLIGMGYNVCEPAGHYDEALQMIADEKPDLLLIDVNLGAGKDGIQLAEKINELHQLPFIFLTANSDASTIERAKKVKPNAYIIKPFVKEDLFAAIEIAFNNYNQLNIATPKIKSASILKEFIFIREQHRFIKILFKDIAYAESCENYVQIHTVEKKSFIIRSTFTDFMAQLPSEKFMRTHRSFAIQVNLIEHIEPSTVFACGYKVPLSKSYRPALYSVLGIKE